MLPRVLFPAALALVAAMAQPAGASPPVTIESSLLGEMHELDQFAMQAGALAQRRGTTPEIRRFGKVLYRDHRIDDDDVRRLSHHYGFAYAAPAPPGRVREDARLMSALHGSTGADFDRRFLVVAHEVEAGTARSLRDLEPHLSQNDIHRMIDRVVPILDQHVAIAESLGGRR